MASLGTNILDWYQIMLFGARLMGGFVHIIWLVVTCMLVSASWLAMYHFWNPCWMKIWFSSNESFVRSAIYCFKIGSYWNLIGFQRLTSWLGQDGLVKCEFVNDLIDNYLPKSLEAIGTFIIFWVTLRTNLWMIQKSSLVHQPQGLPSSLHANHCTPQ